MMRKFFPASVAALSLGVSVSASSAALVVNNGLRDWHDAASDSRADLLLFGDSVVLFGGHGWDAGIQLAASTRYGLAGTGILAGRSAGQGEGYGYGNTFSGWSTSASVAFGNPANDAPLGQLTSTGSDTASIGIASSQTLDPAADYTLDVWAAGDPATGSFTPDRRLLQAPWSVRQTFPSPSLTHTTQRHSFTFDPTTDPLTEFRVRNTTDATLYGIRATTADNHGVSVTSVGRGGLSSRDFFTSFYEPLSATARQTMLDRLVDRGSGKLLVVLMQGFNDRNETQPSLTQGITDGDSPEAFRDNMETQINAISDAWAAGGHNINDLSFLTVGMYPIASGNAELRTYADALEALATADPRVSFVDLPAYTPDFATLNSQGIYADGLHPSQTGSLYFGERLFVALDEALRLADYDGNGQVEQGDLDLVLQNWGLDTHTAPTPAGWVSRLPNGQIDQAELDAVLQHWGSNAAPDFSNSAVPEPIVMLPLLTLTLLAARRR